VGLQPFQFCERIGRILFGFLFLRLKLKRSVSAIEVCAEKTIKPIRSTDAMIALLLIVAFILSGLLSDLNLVPASCASPFFPMTRPPAQGVEKRSAELGACILDACAENPNVRSIKKRGIPPACSWVEG